MHHECLYLHFSFHSPVQKSEQHFYLKTLSTHMPILALVLLADLVHYSHSTPVLPVKLCFCCFCQNLLIQTCCEFLLGFFLCCYLSEYVMVIINVFIMDGIDSPTENSCSYHTNIMNSYHRDRLTLIGSLTGKSYFSKQEWDVT